MGNPREEYRDGTWARVVSDGDTATRRAGESAREQAKRVLAEEPIRLRVARLLRMHTDERAWRVGAKGEQEVARRLSKLPPTWSTVHDLPLGINGANLDHLVIGPGGVFSLNTKNLRGKVWVGENSVLVNGQKTDFLRKARAEAGAVSRILSEGVGHQIEVHPVVVIMGAEIAERAQPRGVSVVKRRRIRSWLEGRPLRLGASEIEVIVKAARNPSTWEWRTGSRGTATEATEQISSVIEPKAGTEHLTVKRWRRYGKDRFYVNDGQRSLGYQDRLTGEVHVGNEADRQRVARTLSAYQKRSDS